MRMLSGDARRAVFSPLDEGMVRSEAVVRRLASAIHLGLVVDGEQLPSESALASSLGVSTMTLRDALAELRDRGLVETRRGRSGGSFVCADVEALDGLSRTRLEQLGTSDLRELGDLHAATSGAAARLAAARATSKEIRRLTEIADRLAEADAVKDRRRLDARFYVELAACSQSVRLTLAEIDMQAECGQLPWPAGDSPVRAAQVASGHRQAVEAVAGRDGDLARSWVEETLAIQTGWLVERHLALLTSRNPSDRGAGEEPRGTPVRRPRVRQAASR